MEMGEAFGLAERARELSDDAYSLWIESARLALVTKISPGRALDPVALLARKSVEVYRLAELIRRMALEDPGWAGGGGVFGPQGAAPSGSRLPGRNGRAGRRSPGGGEPPRRIG